MHYLSTIRRLAYVYRANKIKELKLENKEIVENAFCIVGFNMINLHWVALAAT